MSQTPSAYSWSALRNPFQSRGDENITGHISGRRADIIDIITGKQSAFILTGAPGIGKTSLLRYLQRPPSEEWTWRDELEDIRELYHLDAVHFAQIDLSSLEESENEKELLSAFITQCLAALQSVYGTQESVAQGPRGLRELLRKMSRSQPDARYFVMLDALERLQRPGMTLPFASEAATPEERGLALLHHSEALRILVDLLDEFTQFGVILSMNSLPHASIGDQFTRVSADVARFNAMILQAFSWDDTVAYLEQPPENFGKAWAQSFKKAGGTCLFSEQEQSWLRRQSGTHPYLLQQFCFYTFQLKQLYAGRYGNWPELEESDKDYIIERVNERLSTFLKKVWRRLQQALAGVNQETRKNFNRFIQESSTKYAHEEIHAETWEKSGQELRYILYSEGIVRSDPFSLHYPGAFLTHYLLQKVNEQSEPAVLPASFPSTVSSKGRELIIAQPGKQAVHAALSELEFRLIKRLLQEPQRCSEEELMQAAWGNLIARPVFTQRMHHLRKKLRGYFEDEEVIENRYGGVYLLNHAEWLRLA